MSYTPPSSDALDFSIESSYTPPSSDAIDLSIGPTTTTKTINLDGSSTSTLSHIGSRVFDLTTTPSSTSSLSHAGNAVFALSSSPISTSSLSHTANRLIPITNTLTSTSSLLGEIDGGEISTPNRIGSARLGESQLGTVATIKTVNLDVSSISTFSQPINAIFSLSSSPSSTSSLSQSINAIFTLSQTSASSATLSNSINGTFTLSLKSEKERVGNSRLGSDQLGQPQSFEANSSLTSTIQANISIDFSAASQSTPSFNIARVLVVNLNSTSISSLSYILSEDAYAEQYGRERGDAELNRIVEGNAERDTVVEGDAEIDIIVLGNASVD